MGAKDGGYGFNGGSASHSHTIVKEDPHAEGPQSFLAGDRSAVIQPNSNIPPFYTVIYIIKL